MKDYYLILTLKPCQIWWKFQQWNKTNATCPNARLTMFVSTLQRGGIKNFFRESICRGRDRGCGRYSPNPKINQGWCILVVSGHVITGHNMVFWTEGLSPIKCTSGAVKDDSCQNSRPNCQGRAYVRTVAMPELWTSFLPSVSDRGARVTPRYLVTLIRDPDIVL